MTPQQHNYMERQMYNWTVYFTGTSNIAAQCSAKSAKQAKQYAMVVNNLKTDAYLVARKG